MSSNEIKEELVDWYGGNIKDWKRISKKKKGCYDVRVFENKTLGLTKQIVSVDEDEHIKPEYFPTGEFWIYVNKPNLDISKIDETKSYFNPKIDFTGVFEESNPIVILKSPNGDFWYDQHCSYLIEHWFGVKDFCSNVDEVAENINILIKDIPLKDIRESLEKAGMKFLGYRNGFDEK